MQDDIPSDDEIHERMHPSAADVALAKEIIVGLLCAAEGVTETIPLVRDFLGKIGQPPEAYGTSRHQWPADLSDQIDLVRWINAAHQAIAELDGFGLALPDGRGRLGSSSSPTVSVTRGNVSGGVSCGHCGFDLSQWYRASSLARERDRQGFVLRDADLFLRRIDAPSMHARVAGTLREAVACYRAGLYLASAILIGAASEGAWIQLATAWCLQCEERGLSTSKKLRAEIEGETRLDTVQRLVIDTLRSHGQDDMKRAGLRRSTLDQLAETAAYYRHIRNYAVHFQEDGLEQLDYSTVGVLLLNATRYFNVLYRVKDAF